MNTHHYIESNTPAKRHYELRDGVLKISGKQGFGRFTSEFHLTDVAPHFARVTCIHHRALKRATVYLAIVAGVAAVFAQLSTVPSLAVVFVAIFVALPGLIVLFRFSRPLEIEQFKSHAGVLVFDLIREKRQAAEFDAYIQILRAAILEAQVKKEPNKAPEPTPTAVTSRAIE